MNLEECVEQFRENIGSSSADNPSLRQCLLYINRGFRWLGNELEYRFETVDNLFHLQAGVYTYPLPEDLTYIMWVEWNQKKLDAGSPTQWLRDGKDWRHATAGTPSEFAVDGNNLIIYPPPSADAITTDGFLDAEYIACPANLAASGPAGFTPVGVDCALLMGAYEYFVTHGTGDNQMKRAELMALAGKKLGDVKRQHLDRVHQPHQRIQVYSSRVRGSGSGR